jgi:poly-gamma-glutamate capsule biosynthesis protein CapA/YwtB (metallophosphatase superfamily)
MRMKKLRVLIGGDFCPHLQVEKLCLEGHATEIFGDLMPVMHDTDLSLVNLECPLSTRRAPIAKSGPNLIAHPTTVNALTAAKVDIALMANNHILDHGRPALEDTIKTLDEHGIRHVGAGLTLDEANLPLFVERGGVRIGVLAFAENEFGNASDLSPGSAPLDPLGNCSLISRARQECDALIVSVHGGNEYNPIPSPRMVRTYRAFADSGATAVVCGHPHTPQGYEWHNGTPIVYCPGNLVFPTSRKRRTVKWFTGYLVRLIIEDGRALGVELVPYRADRTTGCIRRFAPDQESAFLEHIEHLGRLTADADSVRRYFDAWCSMEGLTRLQRLIGPTVPPETEEQTRVFMDMRNTMMCEAHHELVTRYMELVRLNVLEEAARYVDELQELHDGPQWLRELLADNNTPAGQA